MDPRMKEKGIPVQPENGFQIRNPWIPLTPGKPVVSRSNGIAIEINGNQLERKNWSEFFELLERKSKQRPNSNRTGNNYDLHEPLTQSSGSYSTTDHQMEIGNSRGGNNFDLTGQMNQHFSSNGTGNDRGTRIMQDGNNYNLNEPLNKSSSLYNMEAHRMGNGILRGGNNFNLAGPLNQISISNGTSNHTRNGFIQGCSNPKFAGQLNQISSSNTRSDHQMGNRFLQGSNNYNPTGRMNQISSSKVTDNHLRNGIIHGGNDSKFIGQLNQISSNTMGNRQMEHRIFQGGDNYSITGRMNQNSSSNITGDHISHEVMLGGNNFNFTGMLNQISSSKSVVDHRMRNENLGNYLKSETQTFQDDILSLRNSPMASNRLIGNTIMIPKANSVISSPLLNLNRQPLSSPRVMNSHNASLIQNYYSEVDNSWTEGNFTSLLLGDEIPDPGPNNNWLNARNSTQMLTDGFHVPALHDNILNTPAMRDIDAGARNANSFPSAPITPDHANMLEKHQQSEMLKFSVDDGSCQEHDKMENLLSSIGNKAIENHCSQVLETIVSPSSTVVTTPQAENKIIDEKGDQDVIDLNETPKQKTPKRRKHRPKVVREGKPKTAPKTKTPKNDELEKDLSKKRKYVRKNKDPEVENATPQETDASIDVPTREESCKKRLNFDFEKAEKAHHQGSQPVLDLNLNYPANQMESHAPTAPSKVINYNTSIVIAKKNSKRNNENRENQNSQEDLNKNISRANIFLERSRMMRWKSTHQMVERDVGNFKGFCGSNGEDHHPNEHVGPPSMCQEPILSKNQETLSTTVRNASEETRKKQKTENDFQTMLCGPEKEHLTNGTCDESTSNAENNMQRKLTILNQEMTLKRMSCRSTQSATTSKNADLSAYQLGREKYEASMQNNGLKIAPNPCRVISFCSNEVPLQERKDTSHPYRQPSIKVKAQPKQMKYSKKTVEEITYRLQSLTISGENGETDAKDIFALLPYEGGGAIIQYEPKKRNPRPKVDLDAETARLWKLLMGKEGSEASEAENKDKEKWWEEERRVFHGRAESFIARMHLVQGDRRFSPWKGSVVDSIIGVFLTQNVSDQLSSSAFMALAAQFPLCSTTADQTSDQSGTSILTEEPEIQLNTGCFEKIMRQPLDSQTSEIYLGSLGTGIMGLETDSFVHHFNVEIQSSSGSSSEAEDSINGGKYVNNIGLANIQHVNRTAPLHALRNPENEHLKQKQGPDQFNSLNSFSLLHYPIDSSITNMQKSVLPPNYFQMLMASQVARSEINYEISREEYRSSFPSSTPEMTKEKHIGYWDNRVGQAAAETTSNTLSQQNRLQNNQTPNMDSFPFLTKHLSSGQQVPQIGNDTHSPNTHHVERPTGPVIKRKNDSINQVPNVSKHTGQALDIQEGTTAVNKQVSLGERPNDGHAKGQDCFSGETNTKISAKSLNTSQNNEKEKKESFDWDSLRKMVQSKGGEKERSVDASDSMDYEAMRCSDVNVISNSIRMRGMNHMLAERIKDFLNRVVTDHGGIDLEWLRDVPPDKSKDYLLSIRGLGLKSVECVRLLTLHHLAFPVDTNVGRIAVRLGWVPLQPLPESLQLHLLEMYPVLETVQKYLWPRLCKLDQKTLYELHYQLITFGKVFCTKSKPNCNACPMRGECRHFASAFASARLALPAPEEKGIVGSTTPIITDRRADVAIKHMLLQPSSSNGERDLVVNSCEPIIEEPATPEPGFTEITEADIEDAFYEDPDEIPTIRLNVEQLAVNLRTFMEEHTDLQEGDMSKALVALTPEVASIPVPKLKYVLRLRTERQVYVLTDTHPLVKGLDKREPDDPSPYLLALLAPGEEASSGQLSGKRCESKGSEEMCNGKDCCSTTDGEANSLTVRGTLLIPCRTATRGSFPLNGTYFQVNEVFADHESSLNPIDVPRAWLWHLETRTVFFGTSATSIFRGMTRKEIQNSFWRGFVCVRGFDRKTRAPRPLNRNLHLAQSKTLKISNAAL